MSYRLALELQGCSPLEQQQHSAISGNFFHHLVMSTDEGFAVSTAAKLEEVLKPRWTTSYLK